MKPENNYDDLNFPAYRKEIISLYKNKMSPERIAKLAGARRGDIERILNEKGVERRTLQESMFKGTKIPTKKELYDEYIIRNNSTCKIGEKYGTSENTVCRWLRKYDIAIRKHGRNALGLPKLPTKKELEYKLSVEHITKREISKEYRMGPARLNALIEQYGIKIGNVPKIIEEKITIKKENPVKFQKEKIVKTRRSLITEKPPKIIKRKTVLDAYLEKEKDLSIEHESGFED
ncbi:MAG: hypothetical protein KKE23_02240 [Nanoarchaeota archaeon]|nr:hypothetical protein [Nanoarchaeota archaeon]